MDVRKIQEENRLDHGTAKSGGSRCFTNYMDYDDLGRNQRQRHKWIGT